MCGILILLVACVGKFQGNLCDRYEAIDYGEPLGEYVYKINGLQEDRVDQAYWALLKQDPEAGACFVGLGKTCASCFGGKRLVFLGFLRFESPCPMHCDHCS